MIGRTISHYKILEKLGGGGMGIVYKAHDTKLNRDVALKFLPPHLTANETEKKRFLQEARAAARLNHPNICTIHEVEEVDGQSFIVMELVDGQTLKEKIKAGPLEVKESIDIAVQVAEGLRKAHEKGIVHRDIKSANIMVNDGNQVKIMDFGLAKLAGQAGLTKTRSTAGTVAYMSPEQIQGQEVDSRSDIWSFGVVFYEMLTGHLPFEGEYESSMMYSILNEQPESLNQFRLDIPINIEQIINKSLKKNKEDRYQNFQEIIKDLQKPADVIRLKEKQEKSIIVLPFVNMSPDPDQEYFSDGLTEEIITDLSQINDLLVISRSSAMTFKGTKKKINEIAREVNVKYVLEGSVRKAGNNLRITAQLIDASTDAHHWAKKYSGTLDDVFDIQEKVSQSIVNALKLKLSEEEKHFITERPFKNVKAYECYLKARQEIDSFTEDGINRAIQYLKSALDVIGESAVLYAGLGYAWWQYFNISSKKEYLENGLKWAGEALKLDPNSSEGHFILGNLYVFSFLRDKKKGLFHLRRAIEIDPNNCEALFHLGGAYLFLGKTAKVVPLIEKQLSIDPLNFYGYWVSSLFHLFEGSIKQSLKQMAKAHELAPDVPAIDFFYALILIYNERFEEVFTVVEQSAKKNPDNVFTKLGVFIKYAIKGKKKEALQSVTPELLKWSSNDFTNPWYLVIGYCIIDEKEQALNWLENWINLGCINYPFLSKYDPFLENIRGEERFKNMMERVKHEWENFEDE